MQLIALQTTAQAHQRASATEPSACTECHACALPSLQQRRPWLSREECELLDVQKEMEEEIVEQYKQVHGYCVYCQRAVNMWCNTARGRRVQQGCA